MELPERNADYRQQDYWDRRYTEEKTFDWFSKYCAFRDLVHRCMLQDHTILMLGCGNSELSEDLYYDGFENITNIDYSPVVIENMKQRCEGMTKMQWQVMDIRELDYADGSFDVVFEKGTLDSLLVTEQSPWTLSQDSESLMDTILSEVSRVLKPGGLFISVTFAQPHFRQLIYAKPKYEWDFEVMTFGTSFHFFFYVMKKGEQLSRRIIELNDRYKAMHRPDPQLASDTDCEAETEGFLLNIQL